MIRALLTGTLHAAPQLRTSQNGKTFATGKLKADATDGGLIWCSIIAFGESAERLAALKANAALSISGRAKVNAWLNKDGEPQAGLDVVIDELVTLRARAKPKPEPAPNTAGFDDELMMN